MSISESTNKDNSNKRMMGGRPS